MISLLLATLDFVDGDAHPGSLNAPDKHPSERANDVAAHGVTKPSCAPFEALRKPSLSKDCCGDKIAQDIGWMLKQ